MSRDGIGKHGTPGNCRELARASSLRKWDNAIDRMAMNEHLRGIRAFHEGNAK
jgi:hypothetical protein